MEIVFYIHILAATAWIGGALLLFALGIFLRDKQAQANVYEHLGPLYGYFESFWLATLLTTGTIMFVHHGFGAIFENAYDSDLAQTMIRKLSMVAILTFLTVIHMIIAFKTHTKTRSAWQHIVSRGSSLLIFFLNLVILWYATQIRTML
jgi:uncharacterized membrane protein